jgi:hypothetical protein
MDHGQDRRGRHDGHDHPRRHLETMDPGIDP